MTSDWNALQGDPGADETMDEWAAAMLTTLNRMTRHERDRTWDEMTLDERGAVQAAFQSAMGIAS